MHLTQSHCNAHLVRHALASEPISVAYAEAAAHRIVDDWRHRCAVLRRGLNGNVPMRLEAHLQQAPFQRLSVAGSKAATPGRACARRHVRADVPQVSTSTDMQCGLVPVLMSSTSEPSTAEPERTMRGS